MKTVIILGSGFDLDLGLENSFGLYSKYYLNPMFGLSTWSDFENKLRQEVIDWYNTGMDVKLAHELNLLWQVYRKNLSYFFTIKADSFELDKKTCAYSFLQTISKSYKIYTFNYTNPYEYVKSPQICEITHVHGQYIKDTFKKDLLVMSQGLNLVLGIDNQCIPSLGIENEYIRPMVKNNQYGFSASDLIADLSTAERVVFFGFSMGVVDFSYFNNFIRAIENGTSTCRHIIYITKEQIDYEKFRSNVTVNKADFDVLRENVIIQPIFTANGHRDKAFIRMLELL